MRFGIARGSRAAALLFLGVGFAIADLSGCGLSTDGASADCVDDLTCADANPCNVETCGADGACAAKANPDGPALTQVPGDCKLAICDGGELIQDDDPSDVDDGNPCTKDACKAGAPVHDVLDGDVCQIGSSAPGICVEGTCVIKCTGNQECNDGMPCTVDSCDLGTQTCAYTANHGALVDDASDTDCIQIVCNQTTETPVPDDGEIPEDTNVCTADSCSGGTAMNVPLPGDPCPNDGVCNRDGNCVGCNSPEDCEGDDTECHRRTCINEVCDIFNEPYDSQGNPPLAQIQSDCKTAICDGNGNPTTRAEQSDVPPDDNNPCTSQACSSDIPSFPPCCFDSACQGGVCNNTGLCVGCNDTAQCGDPPTCKTRSCQGQPQGVCLDADVPAGQDPNDDCPDDGAASCDRTGVCAAGATCALYAAGTVCAPASCGGSPPAQITAGTCNGSGTCTAGTTTPCFPYVCSGTTCKNNCSNNGECQAPFTQCVSGACKKPNGTLCGAGTECASTVCKDNYCCDNACGTVCFDCDVAGFLGTCTPNPAGTDDGACAGNNVSCDGAGVCKAELGQPCALGTDCLSTFCADGVCCNEACGGLCRACIAMKTPASNGTCANVDNGTDPDLECESPPADVCCGTSCQGLPCP